MLREELPTLSDDERGYVLWNETGWPSFSHGDPETQLRAQLRRVAWAVDYRP